jgi:flagellar basal-body rod protein FlgG
MLRSLYIAKSGLDSQQTQVDVISNNLANVSTNGFKKQRAVFEDLIYQTFRQPGAASSQQSTVPSGLQLGTGSKTVATVRNFSQGNLTQTNNSLDVAISGNGFFQVTMADGTTAYTRDGSFQLDAQGQLVNSNGLIIQPPITVPQGASSITIASDGTVTAQIGTQTAAQQLGQIQLATFVNSAGLQSLGGNLMAETAASGTPTLSTPGQNGAGGLSQGTVETSNVNVVEELVNLIAAQRAYEINSKAVTTSDQMLSKLTQL